MSKLDIIALGLIVFAVITITLGIIKVHTYPGKIAKERNHPQLHAIEVTSLLGLIAFPLWMFALIWAYSNAVIGKLYTTDEVAEAPTADPPKRAGPTGAPKGVSPTDASSTGTSPDASKTPPSTEAPRNESDDAKA